MSLQERLPLQIRRAFRPAATLLLPLLLWPALSAAQVTIYWKRDVIAGGNVIATPQPSDTTAPSAPSSLGYSNVTATSVTLSWTGSSDSGGSGMAGYKVSRGAVVVAIVGTTSFTDEGLEPSTGYSYTVKAFDLAGNHSAASNTVTPTTDSE